jgi:hypothetical protein
MKRSTYNFPINDLRLKPHLYIIISDEDPDGNYLAVNVTSIKKDNNGKIYNGQDLTCEVDVNDHPAIYKNKSYIFYRRAMIITEEKILSLIERRCAIWDTIASEEFLKKIQDGAKKSKHLPNEFKKYFEFF